MFTPISKEREEGLRSLGELHLVPSSSKYTDEVSMMHVLAVLNSTGSLDADIVFEPNDNKADTTPLFSADVIIGTDTIIIGDLRISENSLPKNEPYLYMLTKWVIERAEVWADEMEKSKILISTAIPHCTEWFIEFGYEIKPLSVTFNDDKFRAVKHVI
jgi:hypothetical protein